MRRLLLLIAASAALLLAQPKTDIGEMDGAQYRIDVPANWNGVLLLYCHGYNPKPVAFPKPEPNPMTKAFLDAGYAVAQSGYSAGGWAVQEAIEQTQALHRYFVAKHGAPKETYVTGHSMGGYLTAALIERSPNLYDGGLPMCGPLLPVADFIEKGAFTWRVVFDYYFPGVLPDPSAVPADYAPGPEVGQKVMAALGSKPEAAAILRRLTQNRDDKALAGSLAFFTYVLKEMQQRAGGNPFDNTDTIYDRTGDENALNDGVKRYTADPKAAAWMRQSPTLTGRLAKPMLHLHTTYDPLVPPEFPNGYETMAELNGAADLFVQQYVKRDGHCAFQPAEIVKGVEQLREWVKGGKKPAGGVLR